MSNTVTPNNSEEQSVPELKPIAEAVSELCSPESVDPSVDQYKNTWDDLKNIYNSAGKALLEIGHRYNMSVSALYNIEEYEPTPELITATAGLGKDYDIFNKKLAGIYAEHSDKTGPISTDLDMQLSMAIVFKYDDFVNDLSAATMGPMMVLTEELLNLQEMVNSYSDENGVSDAVYVEVESTEDVPPKASEDTGE